MAEIDTTSGPVIACDNAIQHYEKLINAEQSDIDKLQRQIGERRSQIATYQEMLDQWRAAKAKLTV